MVKPAVDCFAEVVSVVRDSLPPSPEQEAIRRPLLPLMLPQPAWLFAGHQEQRSHFKAPIVWPQPFGVVVFSDVDDFL
jgi:hypothetical protein